MNDSHEILGLTKDAGAEAIRQRYLQLVRQNPPERCPERFAEIHAAYEQLKNPVNRIHEQLFAPARESLDDIIAHVKQRMAVQRIDLDLLLSLAED